MAELSGKFQLSDADEDNFDKIMAAVGMKIHLIVIQQIQHYCSWNEL
jgi:predicted component of type VI protein secretion system